MYRIQCKDQTDYNGIESYVFEMSQPQSNTQTDWFPKNMAICVEKEKKKDEEDDPKDLQEMTHTASLDSVNLCSRVQKMLNEQKL